MSKGEQKVRQRRFQSAGLQSLHDRFVGDDPERVASLERAIADAEVATSIFELRTEAGLSQREMAARVGTSASVISRLEDADYDGHSLSMLRRIAAAVGRRVVVNFPTIEPPTIEPNPSQVVVRGNPARQAKAKVRASKN